MQISVKLLITSATLLGCSTSNPSTSSDLASGLGNSPPRTLYDSKPVRVGAFKDPADKAHWWVDASHTVLDWDAEKREGNIPTDTIVIHHTSGKSGRSWQELSDLQYDRIYAPRFKPTIPDPMIPPGVAVQSGHFKQLTEGPQKGKWIEVFYAYHWLVRQDGTSERLLEDNEVGWDAGRWSTNMQSVAICFDGDLSTSKPSEAAMKTAGKLIASYRKKYGITDDRIIGHNDIKATICPGDWFRDGGKDELIRLANNSK